MFRLLTLLTTILFSALRAILRSRSDIALENIALRQQVEALRRRQPRPQLDDTDRAFWLAMRSAWRGWAARLILVHPETVVRWHRDRSRRYWSGLSRQNPGPGRPRVDKEIRELIRRMNLENGWGAPRIHGELTKLGFTVSEAAVSRYMPRRPPDPDVVQRWLAFLRNHVEGIDIVFNELHAVRLARSYIAYFHEDRTHLGLDKDAPCGRPVAPRPSSTAKVAAIPRVGGLHHRYEWRDAA